jgi:hypothetical protein
MSDYVPTADNDFLVWFDHFLTQISTDTAIAPADLAALTAANADFHAKIAHVNDAAALAKQATADKDGCRGNAESLVRAEVRRIKARSTYNEGQGAQLGIVGARDSYDLSTSRPELSGTDLSDGVVSLSFSKHNSDGVNIYSKRENDADWQLLSRASVSPFMDKRALLQIGKPELRDYCVIYVLKDKEIGNYSNEVVVNCTP